MSARDGTHTLALEFSRSANYEISTAMAHNYDQTNIEAEFIDEILAEQIRDNFEPDDIFSVDALKQWAENYVEELE